MTSLRMILLFLVLFSASLSEAASPQQTGIPIREQRPWAILGEAGWNGLSGVGVNAIYHFMPHFALDGGAGLSAVGYKTGLRLRADLTTSSFTPFLGAGVLYGSGTAGQSVSNSDGGNEIQYGIRSSPYAQIVGGLEYMGKGGFVFLGTVGYAKLLKSENIDIKTGIPTKNQNTALDAAYGSGIVLSVAFGYAFDTQTHQSQD